MFREFAKLCIQVSVIKKSEELDLIGGPGSFQRKPIFIAEWMIATEIGCCLRPLGIVVDEQLGSAAFV